MAAGSIRTNEIKLNIPPKVVVGAITSSTISSYWNYPNGSDDKWWLLGANPRGYRYTLDIDITAQTHGSHLTRKPFEYNGMDIKVGDWIGYTGDGVCLKIVSIAIKTETGIRVTAEDYQRYNTFKSVSGNPLGSGSSVVIFELQESGLPVIDPLPTGPGNQFQTNLGARFIRQNVKDNLELEVANNSFTQGQVLSAYEGNIVLSDNTTASSMIGTVSMEGPGPDYVTIRPHSKFVDYDTTLPTGTIGDRIYLNDTGGYTSNISQSNGETAYIIVQNAVPSEARGGVLNPSFATSAFNIELNDVTVPFTGTESLAQIGIAINNYTAQTGVTASAPKTYVFGVSGSLSLAYGLVGGFVPFSATFNGVAVDFTSDYYGNLRYSAPIAAPEDMALAINNANIPGVVAFAPGDGTLTIVETNGNALTIVNTSTDNTGTGGSGVGFGGANSITGIPLNTAGTTDFVLKLERLDGGPIDIYDPSLYFENTTGVHSSQTGRPVLCAYVYDGLRDASNKVVADITARDALTPGTGDMAYVLNDGTGSFALYVWDGSNWNLIGTEESAQVDARTYEVDYSVGDATTIFLGNVSVDRKIETVSADVTVAFDDATANVLVGSVAVPDLLFDGNDIESDVVGTYSISPDYFVEDVSGQDAQYYVTIDPQAATVGNVTIKITYV
jgi:hypothetical protein